MSGTQPLQKATPAVAFSFVLNRLLEAEPWARLRLAPFAGGVVEVRAPGLPTLRLRIVEGGGVATAEGKANVRITLKPDVLAALARGDEHVLRSVDVDGDSHLAAEVLLLARHLRLDVEEELSRFMGDIAARRVARAARAFAAWHVDALGRLAAALGDYLTDEKRILARRAELEALDESVARLRDGIARLDKRLERLD